MGLAPAKYLGPNPPILKAYSAAPVPVSAPMLIALRVTSASPVTAATLIRLAVLVPPLALPIVAATEKA